MKIVQFPGTEKVDKGERLPIPEVVEQLERYLKEAKRGDLRAIAVAAAYDDDETANSIAPLRVNHSLTHAICLMQYRWCEMNDRVGSPDPEEGA